MERPYDVIRLQNGGPMWECAAKTLEDARKRAAELILKYSCECVVYDQQAGVKYVIKPDCTVLTESV
jgi:hypothetical protein